MSRGWVSKELEGQIGARQRETPYERSAESWDGLVVVPKDDEMDSEDWQDEPVRTTPVVKSRPMAWDERKTWE